MTTKPKFPPEYTKKGKFKLHSGEETDTFYDVNALMTDSKYAQQVINAVPQASHYVGIATGGALIAFGASLQRGKQFSMIKDGELKGNMPERDYILIDDVTTRETSLREALKIIGKAQKSIFVAMDRRKNKQLELEAMFQE